MAPVFQSLADSRGDKEEEGKGVFQSLADSGGDTEEEEEGKGGIRPRPVTMHIGEGRRKKSSDDAASVCQICGIDR